MKLYLVKVLTKLTFVQDSAELLGFKKSTQRISMSEDEIQAHKMPRTNETIRSSGIPWKPGDAEKI